MVDTAQAEIEAANRRDSILESVAFAAERLLLAPEWLAAADDVLARLGSGAAVSRAYILANERDAHGTDRVTQRAEWCAPGITPQGENPTLNGAAWEETGFARWLRIFREGEIVLGSVGSMPEEEADELRLQDIVSLCVVPVFVGGTFWGCIGFDDCLSDRDWTRHEVEALRAAAGVLGAAIERQQMEEKRRESERRYRAFVEAVPAVTYTDIPGPNGTVMGFVSPQIEQLLGYPPERFLQDPGLWYSLMHPDDLARLRSVDAMNPADATPFDEEYRMRTADGRWVWVHDTSTAVCAPDGSIESFVGFMEDITARRRAEAERAESEHRYRSLVDHGPDGIMVRVGDRFVFANPRAAEILGADDPSSLVGLPIFDIAHPDHHASIRQRIDTQERGEVAPLMSQRFLRRDGTEVDVEVIGIPITWEGQKAGQIVFRDISERLAAERHLREAEETFRTIVEQNPAVIYRQEFDPGGGSVSRTTYISPRQTELLGYTTEEVEADPELWTRQIHPDDRERVLAADRESNRLQESSFSMEYRMIAKDGRVVWVADQAELVQVEDGPSFWQGFLVDITQRKLAEQAVRESNDRLHQVIDTALDAVVSMNVAGIITGWNPQAEATFGWTSSQAIGRELAQTIIPERQRAAHGAGLRRFLETGEGPVLGHRIEVQALHRDGHEFPVELAIIPLRLGDDVSFSAFVRDISDRKIAERELERSLEAERQAAHRLRDLDEMKNTFLQAVSHDLRTPLSAILGLAITLERGDRVKLSADDARDLAGRIAGNARRLERLVINLLDLDRLARGIIEPAFELADVSTVVRQVLDEAALISAGRLRTDLPELIVPVDAAKLERIVENLLANTARHTPPDATVWVSTRAEADGVLLLVEDDGPGVPEHLREAVFEPFRQGSDDAGHSPGVGVGLALVQRFAELHGGRAWVEERDGGGASFRVWLPGSHLGGAAAEAS